MSNTNQSDKPKTFEEILRNKCVIKIDTDNGYEYADVPLSRIIESQSEYLNQFSYQGDKPTITQGEYTYSQLHFSEDYLISTKGLSIGKMWKECESEAKMVVIAGNLSQKYGSLEQLESRMIEAEKLANSFETGLEWHKENMHVLSLECEEFKNKLIESERKIAAISQLESENEALHKSFTEVCKRVKELEGRIMTMRRLYEGVDYKEITKLENDLLILITQLLTPKQ